jgi:hypothetical protein
VFHSPEGKKRDAQGIFPVKIILPWEGGDKWKLKIDNSLEYKEYHRSSVLSTQAVLCMEKKWLQ